jgi:hypothetical protein
VPAISNLRRLRECFGGSQGVSATTVAGDQSDLWLSRQPSLCCRGFTIGKQRNRPAPLQIADERAITLVASPCPVIDPDHGGRDKTWAATPPHHSQQRILADRHHQPTRKAGGRPSAERKPEMMHDVIEACRSARPRIKYIGVEAFGEHAPTAQNSFAVEAARKDHHANWATCDWQISQTPTISTVDSPGRGAATWTGARLGQGADREQSASFVARHIVHNKATGHESGGSERVLHRIDPSSEPTQITQSVDSTKSESEPNIDPLPRRAAGISFDSNRYGSMHFKSPFRRARPRK